MRSWECELPTHRPHRNTHAIRSFPSYPHRLQGAEKPCYSEIKYHSTCKILVEPMWSSDVNHSSYLLWSGTSFCTWNIVRHASYLTYPRHRYFLVIVSGLKCH